MRTKSSKRYKKLLEVPNLNKAEIIDALKADLTQMSLALCEPEETVLQAINNHELLIGTYEDKFGNKHLYLEYQDVGIMAPIAGH